MRPIVTDGQRLDADDAQGVILPDGEDGLEEAPGGTRRLGPVHQLHHQRSSEGVTI